MKLFNHKDTKVTKETYNKLSTRSVFTVIRAQARIQGIKLFTSWIARKLHCVSRPRLNTNRAGTLEWEGL